MATADGQTQDVLLCFQWYGGAVSRETANHLLEGRARTPQGCPPPDPAPTTHHHPPTRILALLGTHRARLAARSCAHMPRVCTTGCELFLAPLATAPWHPAPAPQGPNPWCTHPPFHPPTRRRCAPVAHNADRERGTYLVRESKGAYVLSIQTSTGPDNVKHARITESNGMCVALACRA